MPVTANSPTAATSALHSAGRMYGVASMSLQLPLRRRSPAKRSNTLPRSMPSRQTFAVVTLTSVEQPGNLSFRGLTRRETRLVFDRPDDVRPDRRDAGAKSSCRTGVQPGPEGKALGSEVGWGSMIDQQQLVAAGTASPSPRYRHRATQTESSWPGTVLPCTTPEEAGPCFARPRLALPRPAVPPALAYPRYSVSGGRRKNNGSSSWSGPPSGSISGSEILYDLHSKRAHFSA